MWYLKILCCCFGFFLGGSGGRGMFGGWGWCSGLVLKGFFVKWNWACSVIHPSLVNSSAHYYNGILYHTLNIQASDIDCCLRIYLL